MSDCQRRGMLLLRSSVTFGSGRTHWPTIGLGAVGTLNFRPSPLGPYCGSRTPAGTFIFLRLLLFHAYEKGTTEMGGMKMDPSHE
jgi:hypothetical protein